MHLKNRITLLLLIATYSTCAGQIKVYDVSDAAKLKNGGGVIYTLAKTKIRIETTVKQAAYSRGDLYNYAWLTQHKLYLQKYIDYDVVDSLNLLAPASSFIQHSMKEKDIVLRSIPVADQSKTFLVQQQGKIIKGSTVNLTLGEESILQGGEQTVDDQTFEIITKGIAGVGKLIFNLSSGGALAGFAKTMNDTLNSRRGASRVLTLTDTLNVFLDELQKLERYELTLKSGQATVRSVEVLKELFDGINNSRLEILAVIAYKETSKTSSYIFDLVPNVSDSAVGRDFRIFSFTSGHGLKVSTNVTEEGKRYYHITAPGIVAGDSVYHIRFRLFENGNAVVLNKVPSAGDLENHYRSNLPAKANAKLYAGNSIVTNLETLFPQWGTLAYWRTKNAKSTFALDPFGALSSITLERKASLNTDRVTAAADLADKLTQKKDKVQEQIDELTKQKTLLELQKAVDELKKTGGN